MEQLLSEALKTGKGIALSEALGAGGMVTVVGLSIVFSVLVVLMLVLILFKVIFYKDPKKAQPAEHSVKVQTQTQPTPVTAQTEDDTELIAVLTAAVAASLNTSTYNLRIKSYRRVDTKTNAWNRAGIRENTLNKTY